MCELEEKSKSEKKEQEEKPHRVKTERGGQCCRSLVADVCLGWVAVKDLFCLTSRRNNPPNPSYPRHWQKFGKDSCPESPF